jgi:hypothetical protein
MENSCVCFKSHLWQRTRVLEVLSGFVHYAFMRFTHFFNHPREKFDFQEIDLPLFSNRPVIRLSSKNPKCPQHTEEHSSSFRGNRLPHFSFWFELGLKF